MYKRLELHNHTTESDSSLSCQELLDYMESDLVDAFALTDHNTISGHTKIQNYIKNHSYHTECIYGMEYTTYYGHILCFHLTEYVPWDSINPNKPELLFRSIHKTGAIAGIAHPFSYGAPFAKGCRFEMNITDFSDVDFIEVFNNPEPLHEVNEKGLLWWEELVLKGIKLAATCGMDLHSKWNLAGEYATFIEGEKGVSVCEELRTAIQKCRTWISRGPLLLCSVSPEEKLLTFTIQETNKPGGEVSLDQPNYLTLKTKDGVITKEIATDIPLQVPFSSLAGSAISAPSIVIPKLYVNSTAIEDLVCLAPVLNLSSL